MSEGNGKKKMGRPKEKVTDKVDLRQLALLTKWGHTDEDIALFYGVTEMTINRWKKQPDFMLALKRAKRDADAYVERSLYKRARKGNVTAIIFWLKNRQPGRWRDVQEHTGSLTMTHTADSIKDDDLAAIVAGGNGKGRTVKDDDSPRYHNA